MIKDFVNLADFSSAQLTGLLDRALDEKEQLRRGSLPPLLAGKTLGMIFEKPSLRTRVSFSVAMTQLGGASINLDQQSIALGKRESVADVARVLGRMCDGICARTFRHETIEQLARYAQAPVVNALSDFSHPCQAMADMLTIREVCGELSGKTLVYIGDGNNVARSLAVACAKLGLRFATSSPKGYELPESFFAGLLESHPQAELRAIPRPDHAVRDADVIYTDTWISMGQEDQTSQRTEDFARYQVNGELLSAAPDGVIVMHCLPAHQGYEITEDVFESQADVIFAQAENRLHFQRALLGVLMSEGGIAQ